MNKVENMGNAEFINKLRIMSDVEKLIVNTLRTSGNTRIFREELACAKKFLNENVVIDFKKVIKKGYKMNVFFGESSANKKVVDALKSYPIINFGTYYYKWQDGSCDYDSWTNWYIIETKESYNESAMIKEARDIIAKILGEDELEGEEICSPYDCTGEIFSYDMRFIRVGKNRVLAKKYFGRDV